MERYCDACKEIRAVGHTCYDGHRRQNALDVDGAGPDIIYSCDRTKYRLEPVKDKSSEQREAFRLVEK
jgi:hypothetical protein